MITDIVLFQNEEELQLLTGLNHTALWHHGFNLDDWDIGFRSPEPLDEDNAFWLLIEMKNYACGYEEVSYGGYYYYMVYHA